MFYITCNINKSKYAQVGFLESWFADNRRGGAKVKWHPVVNKRKAVSSTGRHDVQVFRIE